MNLKYLLIATVAVLCIFASQKATAGQTIPDVGYMACVTRQVGRTEPEKGHKLVDFAAAAFSLPGDEAKSAGPCVGKYEYRPATEVGR